MAALGKRFIMRSSRTNSDASLANNQTPESSREQHLSAWSWQSLFDRELEDFLSTEKPLRTTRVWYYSLSLLPKKKQKDMAILLAEANSIFGALFLNGIWFFWEYGNSRDFQSDQLHLAFEISCAIGVISTAIITMYSVFLWMCLLSYSGSQDNIVLGSTQYFACLFLLLMGVLASTLVSVAIAVYNRLNDQSNVAAIVLSSLVPIIYICWLPVGNQLMVEQAPLEVFHFPRWFRVPLMPWTYAASQKKVLKEKAAKRAEYLKKLSGRDTARNAWSELEGRSELEVLLREACKRLGRPDANLAPFLKKLELDWHDDLASLHGRSVDFLNRYMPHALAETIHDILKEQKLEEISA